MYDFQTGDLILFDGKRSKSKLIQYATGSNWSHCGILFKCPKTEKLWIWEVGGLSRNAGYVIQKKNSAKRDSHITCFDTRIPNYCGMVAVRRLKGDIIDQQKLKSFMIHHLGIPYSLEIKKDLLDRLCWHCSQLVAETYDHLGIIKLSKKSFLYSPDYFAGEFETVEGFSFGELEIIHNDYEK